MMFFSVYDSKAAVYLRPFTERNEATAIRAFLAAVSDDETPIGVHPLDYSLWLLGSFNEESGVIAPETNPVMISNGAEAMGMLRQMRDQVAAMESESGVSEE